LSRTKWRLWGGNGELIEFDQVGHGTWLQGAPHGWAGNPSITVASSSAHRLRSGEHRGPARTGARTATLPVAVSAPSETELWQRIDDIAAMLDPTWGADCRIEVERPDGETRSIFATYVSGWDPDLIGVSQGVATARLTFKAHDPFWLSSLRPEVRIDLPVTGSGSTLTDWDDPAVDWDDLNVPWDGFDSAGSNGAMTTVENQGTAEAWPIFRVTGPAEKIVLVNASLGQSWEWNGNLLSGSMLIDFGQRIILADGENAWPGLGATRQWWPLRPGLQYVFVGVTGSDTNTKLDLSWHPRFLSP